MTIWLRCYFLSPPCTHLGQRGSACPQNDGKERQVENGGRERACSVLSVPVHVCRGFSVHAVPFLTRPRIAPRANNKWDFIRTSPMVRCLIIRWRRPIKLCLSVFSGFVMKQTLIGAHVWVGQPHPWPLPLAVTFLTFCCTLRDTSYFFSPSHRPKKNISMCEFRLQIDFQNHEKPQAECQVAGSVI